MAESLDKFCTVCDPSPVRAMEWCSECEDFFCPECIKFHKASKTFKSHSTMTIDQYNDLPEVVKNFKFHCEEHEEKLDSYCPVHSFPCCIRCALSTHKSCIGVAPLRDFSINCKSSPSVVDIDQTLVGLSSHIEKVTEDKRKNKQEIKDQKKSIREEISDFRKSLNDHLDQLEHKLVDILDSQVENVCSVLDSIVDEFKEAGIRVENILKDHNKIKENGTDLQTFLWMPLIMSSVLNEEKCVHDWKEDGKLNSKQLEFNMETKEFMKVESIGELYVKEVDSEIVYISHKEKGAQITNVGTAKQMKLQLKKRFQVNVYNSLSSVTGCSLMSNKYILFSEYNTQRCVDQVTLYNIEGIFIRCVLNNTNVEGSIFGITPIDETAFAVSVEKAIHIFDFIKQKIIKSIHTISPCKGLDFHRGNIIFCHKKEGIRSYGLKDGINKLFFEDKIGDFSYICGFENYLFFTNGTDRVQCFDMDSKRLSWQFEDAKILRLARGIIVDKIGRVIVAGENSGNLVVISSDGKHSKELLKSPNPRALCYNKHTDQLIVCSTKNDACIYDICDN